MNKTLKIYGFVFVVVVGFLAFLQLNKKPVIDWRKNFDLTEKTPFGLFVFNKEMEALFSEKVTRVEGTPYQFLNEKKSTSPKNFIIIEEDIDKSSFDKLIAEVEKGSDLMIFGEDIPYHLRPFQFEYYTDYANERIINFTDEKLKSSLKIDKLPNPRYIAEVAKNIEILGKFQAEDGNKGANFIKYKQGKGNVYIHSEPIVLTNYYLLKKENQAYIQDVFSYLKDRETVWFVNNFVEGKPVSQSLLRVVLSNPFLKYAWWLFLLGLLLFGIFNAKRKQRIVPIIEPPKNQSAEFVKTIGNLYLQEGDFRDMMAKKAQYFLHKVRTELYIDTQKIDENFAEKLQIKTAKPLDKIKKAIDYIQKSNNKQVQVTREDLIEMNQLLDEIL